MNRKTLFSGLIGFVWVGLSILAVQTALWAGTTGKIAGVVTDADTGAPACSRGAGPRTQA